MFKNNLSQEQIKQLNRVNIIKYIRDNKTTTKYEISQHLGISVPTVTSNINDFIEENLIEVAGVARSTGGRKPAVIKLIENARYSFGVNIMPNMVSIILVNLKLVEMDNREFPYHEKDSFEGVLEYIKSYIDELMKTHQISHDEVLGVGIALPGVVDDSQLMLWDAPNINVHDYNFSQFEKSLNLKIFIENEANVAAFAEMQTEKMEDINNLVYVSITEGIGTGIIIHNHIYKGTNKKAGEFGHHRISNEGKECNCGRLDCWEIYGSNAALLKYYNDYSVVKINTFEEIFREHENHNFMAKEAIERYIDYLCKGIENIILGLSPDYVVIGGEIANYSIQLTNLLSNKFDFDGEFIVCEGSRILFSELKDKGALIGAATLPLEEIFNFRTNVL